MSGIWRMCLIALTIIAVNLPFTSVVSAAFDNLKTMDGIAICEVTGYGDWSLKKEHMETFKDLLSEKIQMHNKLRVERIGSVQGEEDPALSEIHMTAIISGDNFEKEKEKANLTLYRYWEENKNVCKQGLTVKQRGWIKNFASEHRVNHLVFCNIKEVKVDLKRQGNMLDEDALRGMKLKLNIDYYVIDCRNGEVFRGNSYTDKSTGVVDLLLVKYGKTVTVQQLLQGILEKQAERLSEEIMDKVT